MPQREREAHEAPEEYSRAHCVIHRGGKRRQIFHQLPEQSIFKKKKKRGVSNVIAKIITAHSSVSTSGR